MDKSDMTLHALNRHIEDILTTIRTRPMTDDALIEFCLQIADIKKHIDKKRKMFT